MGTLPEHQPPTNPELSPVSDLRSLGLIALGWAPWGRSWKRNQSMVYQLSQLDLFERTLFVNPAGMWIADQFRPDEGSLRDRLRRVVDSMPHKHGPNIRVYSQWHFVPFKGVWDGARHLENWLFLRSLLRYMGGRPYVLLNNHPNFYSRRILETLMDGAELKLFDLSDDFVEFFTIEKHREHFRKQIEFCCSHSDVVLSINEHVAEKYRPFNANNVVIPNSTNFSNFNRSTYRTIPALARLQENGAQILGLTGIINRIRIDYELLEAVVSANPTRQFVFVGSADPSFIEIAQRVDNLHHFPQVPYDELPDWIHHFDAAIIPFRVNEHTAGNDLLKFHDYLAMGKSVVTTNTGGAWKFEGLVHIAKSHEEFLGAIDRALEPSPDDLVARRVEMARGNSWTVRAREVESVIREHLGGRESC